MSHVKSTRHGRDEAGYPLAEGFKMLHHITRSRQATHSVWTDDQLRKAAPSIFAEVAHARTSERYTQIPTSRIVDAFRGEGWQPTFAGETVTRDESRRGFARHIVRFRRSGDVERTAVVGDSVPEIVLLNSHDGSSSYQIHAGIFRFVCANGMVVADSTVTRQAVRHSGNIVDNVIEGVYEIVKSLPLVMDKMEQFKALPLSAPEQLAFAESAGLIRWTDGAPIQPAKLAEARRTADIGNDLWSVFNRTQENLIRGGQSGHGIGANGRFKRTTTRAIKGVTEDVRINKALWALTEAMAKLKAAA